MSILEWSLLQTIRKIENNSHVHAERKTYKILPFAGKTNVMLNLSNSYLPAGMSTVA